MRKTIKLKRGLDLKLAGGVTDNSYKTVTPERVAVIPDDFAGFTPKLEVREGDIVLEGDALMHDKTCLEIKLVSPAHGTVEQVVRGARRHIERVVIKTIEPESPCRAEEGCGRPAPFWKNFRFNREDADSVRHALMDSGLWAMIRRRPFDIIPQENDTPRDIFVTAFDSTPLAPSLEAQIKTKNNEIEAGIKALSLLTTGHIYIGVRPGDSLPDYAGAVMVEFAGPHPAGNTGIQAANIAPVNKGDVIWTLDIVTLARIGSLMLNGSVPMDTVIAVTGPEVEKPTLIETKIGAEISPLLKDNIKNDGHNHRIISGNVLTGEKVSIDGFIHFPWRQLTVIPEGDDTDEFMGWASIAPSKMSVNRSFPGHFLFGKMFKPDARLHGGRRAMIMSGQYDKVFPMDILPEYLIKAIIARDIDRMEQLGIYEVAPEDFALAEYVDPSKLELQKIVREGLDFLRNETT